MDLIITLPDGKSEDILENFAKSAGYRTLIQDPEDPDNAIPNPISHEDFCKDTIKKVIMQNAKKSFLDRKAKAQRKTDETEANNKLDF